MLCCAGRGRGERERGRQVWGGSNKTQKSVEGGSLAEKHATFASASFRFAATRLQPARFVRRLSDWNLFRTRTRSGGVDLGILLIGVANIVYVN